MVNGIGSQNYYLNSMQNQAMRPQRPDPAEMFKKIDTDGSGGISQSELDAWAKDMSAGTGQSIDTSTALSTYDTDGNSELSSDEMDAFVRSTMQQGVGHKGMHGPGPGGILDRFDSNGSGGLSRTELDSLVSDISSKTGQKLDGSDALSTYDKDGDGELSSTELKNFLDASGIKPPEQSGQADASNKADSVISKYDTNGDGVLSATELQAYLDGQSSSSSDNYFQQALSAYNANMTGSSSLQELFMSFLSGGNYTPLDFSV